MSMNGIFSYEKLVIKEGYGKYKPNEFSESHILLHNQQPVQQASCTGNSFSSIGYQLDEEIEITVGHGMTHVACTVDLCLLTMFEGEKCRLLTKCNNTQSAEEFITLEVTLLSFVAATDFHGTSYKDKVMRAVTLKELGTSAFTAGHFTAAFHKFSRSLKYLICSIADTENPVSSCVNNDALSTETCANDNCDHILLTNDDVSYLNACSLTREDIARLTCHCWLNLAACQLRYQNFRMAAANCSKALCIDQNNVKGLFRRAQCYIKTGNEHAAVIDLELALSLEPGSREIARLLNTARQLTRKSDDSLAAAMSKMFR